MIACLSNIIWPSLLQLTEALEKVFKKPYLEIIRDQPILATDSARKDMIKMLPDGRGLRITKEFEALCTEGAQNSNAHVYI